MIVFFVQITSEDKFPKYICDNCIKSAEQSYSFRVLCETSEKTLKEEAMSRGENCSLDTPVQEVICIISEDGKETSNIRVVDEFSIEEDSYEDDFGKPNLTIFINLLLIYLLLQQLTLVAKDFLFRGK